MMREKEPEAPGQPGVIATIAAGFDLITGHLWLMTLPVLLDLWLWLGPRLTTSSLLTQSLAPLQGEPQLAAFTEQMVALAPRVNWFTLLSFPVIGVPTLMTGPTPEKIPIAASLVDIASMSQWFLIFFGLNMAGLLLAILFYNGLAQALRAGPFDAAQFGRRLLRSGMKLVGLVLVFGLCLLIIGVALLPVALILALVGLGATPAVLLGGVVAIWLAIYLFFSIHGIVLYDAGIFPAMLTSVRLVQVQIWPTLLLLLSIVVVGGGLNTLWRQVDNGSWLTLVSILGHGFINTALVMSTFVFYRDRIAPAQQQIAHTAS